MKPRIELTFTKIEYVPLPGQDVAATHVFFTDAGGQEYALLMGIGGTLWNSWGLDERSEGLAEKIVFQAAEEYIDEMIWKGRLQEMIRKTPFHKKVYGIDDKDPEPCPYDPKQPLPPFPFTRVCWPRPGISDVERRKEERMQFLLRLYKSCAGKIESYCDSKKIARALDIDLDNLESILVFLFQKGFIKFTADGFVSITSDGIEEAEKYQTGLEQTEINRGNSSARKSAPPPSTDFYMTCNNLHEKVKERCLALFEQGKYDEAILIAMKVVEVEVRAKSGCDNTDIGVKLIAKALNPKNPILKLSDIPDEREAAHALFRGAIGSFKNPQSHRFLDTSDPVEAFECLCLASLLMRMLEEAKGPNLVTLVEPYPKSSPDAPTDKISVQYAVIEIAKQAGLDYDWDGSQRNCGKLCYRLANPDLRNVSMKKALMDILDPLGLNYEIKDNKIVLKKK